MKHILITVLILFWITEVSIAQYAGNALLFSQPAYGSTARSKAMGNAFGALGGDFGSLSINPAGIGIYLQSELSTTLGLVNLNKVETSYQGAGFGRNDNHLSFNNFGFVGVVPVNRYLSSLVSLNFGIGGNRLADFHQKSYVSSAGSPYSRMDAFVQNTNGINYNLLITPGDYEFEYDYDPYAGSTPWESKLAWENYLIQVNNPEKGGDQYSTFLLENEKVKQRETAGHEGYINEYLAAFGLNFNHQIYIGATLSMQSLLYEVTTLYSEEGIDEVSSSLKSWGSFDYTSYSKTSGHGFNAKIGAIYRPFPALRIGISMHTPTRFRNKVTYRSSMNSDLVGVNAIADGKHLEITPTGKYEYYFQAPFRAIGSLVYQVEKKGLLSVDYEIADYSASRYSNGLGGEHFPLENGEIKDTYRIVRTLRMGAEYKVTNTISVRGGLELYGNPYKVVSGNTIVSNWDYLRKTYNFGIGYRLDKYSFDLTWSMGDKISSRYLFHLEGIAEDRVQSHTTSQLLLFTFSRKI